MESVHLYNSVPDWLLAEIGALNELPPASLSPLIAHIVEVVCSGAANRLSTPAVVPPVLHDDPSAVTGIIAALHFIVSEAAIRALPQATIGQEALQLGMKEAHAGVLSAALIDADADGLCPFARVRTALAKRTLRLPTLAQVAALPACIAPSQDTATNATTSPSSASGIASGMLLHLGRDDGVSLTLLLDAAEKQAMLESLLRARAALERMEHYVQDL
jgi:hypothetical protein